MIWVPGPLGSVVLEIRGRGRRRGQAIRGVAWRAIWSMVVIIVSGVMVMSGRVSTILLSLPLIVIAVPSLVITTRKADLLVPSR